MPKILVILGCHGKWRATGWVLAKKGHLKNVSLVNAPKTNRITNVEAYTSAPFLPIPCYLLCFLHFVNFVASFSRCATLSQLMMLNIASTKSARLFLYFK